MDIKIKTGQILNRFLDGFNLEIIKTHPKEAIKFAKKYFQGKEIIAAEIGVFYGTNAYYMNKLLNIKKFYLIDSYSKYAEYKEQETLPLLERAKSNAHRINNKGNEIWIEYNSEEAILKIPMIDFLYIDGNHEYSFVKKDLELYWKRINTGGIISGHDIQYEEVSKAVLEFAFKNKLNISFGDRRDWWIVKC